MTAGFVSTLRGKSKHAAKAKTRMANRDATFMPFLSGMLKALPEQRIIFDPQNEAYNSTERVGNYVGRSATFIYRNNQTQLVH